MQLCVYAELNISFIRDLGVMSCGQAGGAGKCREQRRTGGNKSAPSPALLTSYIQKAWTIDELFRTCTAHENSFNHIHISACWNKLGNLTKTTDRHWFEKHAQALNSLVQHTTRMVLTSSSIRARQIATIAHGVAKSGIGTHVAELMTALARSIQQHLRDCNPQELANLAWAFAKASHADADLFALLARAAEKSLSGFNPQELTNTAWAFATAGHLDTELFSALARVVARCLHDFNTQGLANTAWAFAKVGHFDALLFGRIASRAQQRLCDFNSQDIVNTAWAFAKAGQYDSELFSCLSRYAESSQ